MHCYGDPESTYMDYRAKDLIKYCAKQKFDVISITNHWSIHYNEDLARYAKKQGILLIPGMEARVKGYDMLIINPRLKARNPTTLRRVKWLKDEGALVIAPHPFFRMHSMGRDLEKNIDLVDGIEYSYFYNRFVNLNRKAEKIAKKYNKPLIGTSDTKYLHLIGSNYTQIDAAKNVDSVLEAIRKNKVKVVTRPLTVVEHLKAFNDVLVVGNIKSFFYNFNGHAKEL